MSFFDTIKELSKGIDFTITCKLCGEELRDYDQKMMIEHLKSVHGWKDKPTFREIMNAFTPGYRAKEK